MLERYNSPFPFQNPGCAHIGSPDCDLNGQSLLLDFRLLETGKAVCSGTCRVCIQNSCPDAFHAPESHQLGGLDIALPKGTCWAIERDVVLEAPAELGQSYAEWFGARGGLA